MSGPAWKGADYDYRHASGPAWLLPACPRGRNRTVQLRPNANRGTTLLTPAEKGTLRRARKTQGVPSSLDILTRPVFPPQTRLARALPQMLANAITPGTDRKRTLAISCYLKASPHVSSFPAALAEPHGWPLGKGPATIRPSDPAL